MRPKKSSIFYFETPPTGVPNRFIHVWINDGREFYSIYDDDFVRLKYVN